MFKKFFISWSIEFGPIISFFITLSLLGDTHQGFLTATGIFTTLTALALLISYKYEKRIAWFPLITGIIVILFGVITLFLKEPIIFIWKDTFYNGGFALVFLVGVCYRKPLLKPLFIALFDMSDKGWLILSLRWGLFFLLLTLSNEIVWRNYDQSVWVSYKFWSTILTVIFGFAQITLARKYRNKTATKWGMQTDPFHLENKNLL